MKQFNLTIIDRYLEQELLMASLYEQFAHHYAAHREFWISMVSEEHEHAGWIRQFQASILLDKMHFFDGKPRLAAVEASIDYINKRRNEFDLNHLEHRRALSICLDIERSLLERNVFSRFSSDSPETQKILTVINDEQVVHLRKVEHYCELHRV